MIARTESLVACWTSTGAAAGPLASWRALIFSPTAFSRVAQLPSSAETISPLAAIGQFGLVQDAPSAFLTTVARSSFRPSKKVRHSGSTAFGSRV